MTTHAAGSRRAPQAGRALRGFRSLRSLAGLKTGVPVAALLVWGPVGAVGGAAGQEPVVLPGMEQGGAIPEDILEQYQERIAAETLTFTIAQAMAVISELHPDVRRGREEVAEYRELAREARSPYLPQLNLNLQVAQTRDPGFRNSPFFSRLLEDPGASPFGDGAPPGDFGGAFTFGTYLWNLQASQVLWSFGRRPALRSVDVNRALAEADLDEVRNRVARDAAVRLYSYVLGLRTHEVLSQAVETAERGLQLARDRLELGAGSRLEVLRARVQASQLRRQLSDAEDGLALERAGVNAAVGREQTRAIEVLDTLELPDPVPRVLPAEALMELAGQRHPELRRFRLDRELLAVETDRALAEARPEVRASASYGINTFSLENTYDLQLHNWNAGVTLNWSLFDGFGRGARVASLRSRITQKDWEERAFESTLEVTLRNAVANWHAALDGVEEATLALEEAAEAERVAGEELDAGAATPFLVMETAQTRREVELEAARHTHDALAALAEVKYLVGYSPGAPHSVVSDTLPAAAVAAAGPAGARGPELEERR